LRDLQATGNEDYGSCRTPRREGPDDRDWAAREADFHFISARKQAAIVGAQFNPNCRSCTVQLILDGEPLKRMYANGKPSQQP
jgi:hypothetical protein